MNIENEGSAQNMEKKIYVVCRDGENQEIYLNLTEAEYMLINNIFNMTGIYDRDLVEIGIKEF